MAEPLTSGDLSRAGLDAIRRFIAELPAAAKNWPKQAWELGRLPADLVLGSPEQNRMDKEWEGSGIKPLADTATRSDTHKMRSPERRAHQVAEFANPLINAMFAPKQSLALASSPVGQATLGGLAALMTGVGDVAPAAAPALAGVVKQKGGNWVSGSVEDALRGLKKDTVPDSQHAEFLVRQGFTPEEAVTKVADMRREPQNAVDLWIDQKLAKYVKNEMATPEDPVRALAERGTLHFDAGDAAVMRRNAAAVANRERGNASMGGTQSTRLGQSPLAQAWETVSDSEVRPGSYTSLMPSAMKKDHPENLFDMGGEFAVKNPEAEAYMLGNWSDSGASRVLGFNHLIDELSNAVNPASGLPQHLQFPADRLSKVTVPQAVERVAQINAWRAAQKAEADALKANNAATVLHKEYPEKGMRWVELTNPSTAPSDRGLTKAELDADGVAVQQLKDALKYEGDTMGHCVGGYCDDVLSGRSRIYSLRDKKGQPHVTIETSPPMARIHGDVDDELYSRAWQEAQDKFGAEGEGTEEFLKAVDDRLKELKATEGSPWRILQIKGKGNAKPNEEYLPFIQDFVRSGKWSDVGDFANTGLRRTRDAFNENEIAKIREAGRELSDYHTPDEIQEIGNFVWPGQYGPVKYTHGGKVDAPPDRRPMIVGGVRGRSDWDVLFEEPFAGWDVLLAGDIDD